MKKDIEWLNEQVGELNSTDAVFNESGASYIDTAVSIDRVYELINQLDEPEVLSQEWIRNNQERKGVHFFVNVTKLQNLLVPKQELPVIPKYVAEYLEYAKKHGSLIKVMELASISGDGLTMKEEYDWISANDETFARAWLDGYEVEDEPLYHALIKGHEVSNFYDIYWNYDKSDDGVFVSRLHPPHDNFLNEMSKEDWNKLGINDSNADFVKVHE